MATSSFSFSGGKDSTVLLDLVRRVYPDVPAVFCDTGLEYPEIRKFAQSFDNVCCVKPVMRFDEVISTYGYPIIGKEVAEAIYYARRIVQPREREREKTAFQKKTELLGLRKNERRQTNTSSHKEQSEEAG